MRAASGSMFGLAYGDALGKPTEFMDYPAMIPGVSLIDWETGEPNARYHALALLLEHFGPGDQLAATTAGRPDHPDPRIHAQGFVTSGGDRKLLLINKTAKPLEVVGPADDPLAIGPYQILVLPGGPAQARTVRR